MFQLFHFLHRSFILRQGKVISLYAQHLDINPFLLTKFRQISSLPCNCFIFLFADRLCKSHLLQCLSQTIACFHACFIAIRNRNIINVQVWRCFIQVHNTIKQIQIGITLLKRFCILLQYFNSCLCLLSKLSICTHHRSVILFAYLNDILVECLFFITGILYFFQIIFLSTILTLLSCIILHKCLPKAFLIRLFQRFLYINSVPSCPFGYHIITDKLSVIMCQMSLSLWKRNCFCSQSFYLLSSSNALNAPHLSLLCQ